MEELISQLNDLPTGHVEVLAADAQQATDALEPSSCCGSSKE
ncbi:hypothetical protein AB0L06_25555 [Spirillospora sp. NPDC052269]